MMPCERQRALSLLYRVRATPDLLVCREIESLCHSVSAGRQEYKDHIRHAAYNLRQNPRLGLEVVCAADGELAKGTVKGRIEAESQARQKRFEEMLQEKYDALNDKTFTAIVRCRRCGSEEVSWEEKQTRSADEGASLFCVCNTCKNRWVTR